ncbi:MAG: RNA-binding S4 domain-containing protein [Bacteroidales bacterium]|jgi:ribosome-associated heat shock protein Hsp15|nr:RNA-binding S4 domain-containing protein [Bacteroidales bacterium]MBQ3617219.1 RNA-binding S4 domain-containing protein [Bacteroidales bacterium]MDD6001786.1 RNA-binding S4 domain-containing protein [Bacteroidales bacterium]
MAEENSEMRIDKFLFNVRLFKTRSLAADACGKGRILINGAAVKPARVVRPNDEISVKVNPVYRRYKVLQLLRGRVGAAKVPDYITETTSEDDLFKLKMMTEMGRFSFGKRDRGAGRPTKKDRRDIDRLYDSDDEYDMLDGFMPDFDNDDE